MIPSLLNQSKSLRLIQRQKKVGSSLHIPLLHNPSFSHWTIVRRSNSAATRTNEQSSLSYNRDTGIISSIGNGNEDSTLNTYGPLFHTIIGIEIHAQLSVPSKLFSPSPTKHSNTTSSYSTSPNTSLSLHDIGYPGTLPVISKQSVQFAVLSAAALQCQIQPKSRFERKHYFYPDLPLGYQVTQQRWPLAKDGELSCRRYVALESNSNNNNSTNERGRKQAKKKRRRGGGNEPEKQSGDSINPTKQDTLELSKFFNVGIDRIQIEQDTGKTTTMTNGKDVKEGRSSSSSSLIDFNRAGCTLIEVVFKPQIKSAHEAASVVSTVQALLRHIRTCDGKMEDGSVRVDLNISIAPTNINHDSTTESNDDDNPFQKYLPPGVGKRVEVKNLNSLKQIIQSVEYEGIRQAQSRLHGHTIHQETRTFDPKKGQTIKIRDKGGAVDYRFMPEPDLPPLILNESVFDGKTLDEFLEDELPELPEEATLRLMEEYGLNEAAALIITSDRAAIGLYEEAVKVCINSLQGDNVNEKKELVAKIPVVIGNWLCNDLFALVKESALTRNVVDESNKNDSGSEEEDALAHPISLEYSNVDSRRFGLLLSLVIDGIVSTTQGKKLLDVMYKEDLNTDPQTIAEQRGWKLITNIDELKKLCHQTLLDPKNEKQLNQYKQGGKHVRKMKKFFIGKIMAHSKGNAHPELLRGALDSTLDEVAPGVKE